ncbi:MAG: 4-hydroxy-3-methylbut-2-en-1-yl diphosphate synthase [Prevotella sp.]|nr:4-hydroxy-3-methylbut-2-en-1-yl diphosphate synthase [Prevotella sp.]
MTDLFNYHRRKTCVVNVGSVPMGGDYPIRVQSMATVSTNDTEGCVAQARRIIEAGGEYVRFTTQGTREAENLSRINARLRAEGVDTPLVADVHFNPHVAEVAARYAEKVRINPGNYVDPARTFRRLEYTDEEYAAELRKIEETLLPLLQICRVHHTALRIGVNHGSLSDRIMSRYGDTPEGIVESCMEFLRICRREDFNDVVISIKASNTVVMVRSVRLLVHQMDKEDMHFPLHLGVTEAGEGEDGRIKSAVGIGALLADGIGDTVRVSLSEAPECEIPVARHLVDYISTHAHHTLIPTTAASGFDYLRPKRRTTTAIGNIGGSHVPVVVMSGNADIHDGELRPDFIYTGQDIPETRIEGQRYIVDYNVYDGTPLTYPIFPHAAMPLIASVKADMKFLMLYYGANLEEYTACLKAHPEVVAVCVSRHANRLGEQRAFVHELMKAGVTNPVVFAQPYAHSQEEKGDFQIEAAADMGALMLDGLTDGLWLLNDGNLSDTDILSTSLGILQAARLRMSKTEYISCPGCGRTLYDLQTTIARIKAATQHLKGLKIGIMGCIVNGPGEMADADYGYVGAGRGKISLYRGKECVEKNIPEAEAVEHLLRLIENDKTPKS